MKDETYVQYMWYGYIYMCCFQDQRAALWVDLYELQMHGGPTLASAVFIL